MSEAQAQHNEDLLVRSPEARPPMRLGHAFAGHARAQHHHSRGMVAKRMNAVVEKRADETQCTAGGLYVAPAQGATISSANKTTIRWDNACLDKSVSKIDIYLYAPQSAARSLPIKSFRGIPAKNGEYEVQLYPQWWNQTADAALAVNIVNSGNEPWDSINPVGPTWQATYQLGSPLPKGDPSEATKIISVFYSGGSLTKSGMTAAIVCPLILVLCALGVWVRKLHINRNNKTVDWAEHMDKRMSRISLDWTSGGDGTAGPTPGSRPASFMRPQSQFGRQGSAPGSFHSANMAGRGAGVYEDEMSEAGPPAHTFRRPNALDQAGRENRQTLTQSRISFAQSTGGDRISRISVGPAPSSEGHQLPYARTHKSSSSLPRVGHNGQRRSNYNTDSYYDPDAPALPKLPGAGKWQNRDSRFDDADSHQEHMHDDGDLTIMSPTQNQGATPLGNGDIDGMRQSLDVNRTVGGSPLKNRAVTPIEDESDRAFRNSVLAYPALSMVTGGNGREESDGNDMFAAMTSGRPISGLSEGADSAYAPTEQTRASEYIDHGHYRAGTHAVATEHPARLGVSANTGMAPASNHTSPDEALKQYAALRTAPSAGPGSNSGGMRTLYTPEPSAVTAGAGRRGSSIYIDAPANNGVSGHRPNGSVNTAGSSINEDDVVGYNDMEHFNNGR